jgi:hypothetical protein
MNTHVDKSRENKSQTVSHGESQKRSNGESTFQFVDNRPEAIQMQEMQELANNSSQVAGITQLQAMADNFAVQKPPIQRQENKTGLPDNLKSGMENLSGHSMDDVKVHRNSDKPAQLNAHAYAQGTDIHLGPGQEKHLPHELGHVVQQKEGRVKSTKQLKDKVAVNDDAGLEKEADVLGTKALQMKTDEPYTKTAQSFSTSAPLQLKVQDESGEILSRPKVIGLLSKSMELGEIFTALKGIDLERAIDPKNDMIFTPKNIIDYIDGEKISGISVLGKSDQNQAGIMAATAEPEGGEKALGQVETLKATIKNMNENRDEQKKKEVEVQEVGEPVKYKDESTNILAKQFEKSVFYYGQTGESSMNPAIWKNLMARAKKVKKDRMGDDIGTYAAGTRNLGFLKGKKESAENNNGIQHLMMDMYYGGQDFEAWHMMRDPLIGQYIHDMMGYAGTYDQTESPDTTFRKNFPLGGNILDDKGEDTWQNRGWSQNSKPKNNENMKGVPDEWNEDKSGTMEISRLIRDGVFKFGGTIVFEASGVYSQGNFVDGARKGDTNVEAESMLPEFAGKNKSRVKFGKGEYVFHWRGNEVTPTREIFLSYWAKGGLLGREVDEQSNLKQGGPFVNYVKSTAKWGEDKKGTGVEHNDEPVKWFWAFPAR